MPINLNIIDEMIIGCLVLGIFYFLIAKYRNTQRTIKIVEHALHLIFTIHLIILAYLVAIRLVNLGFTPVIVLLIIIVGIFLSNVVKYGIQDFGISIDSTKFNIPKMKDFIFNIFLFIFSLICISLPDFSLIGTTEFTLADLFLTILPLITIIALIVKMINKRKDT